MRNRIKNGFGIVLGVLLFSACSQEVKVVPIADQIVNIEKLQDQTFNELKEPNDSIANLLMDAYEAFAQNNPTHEQAPVYLDQSANIARSVFKDYNRALSCYEKIVSDYPTTKDIVNTKFLIAFIYDNDLKNKAKAEGLYRGIAEDHPDHIFGRNAKARLETLHMSDEELIQHFKEKNSEATEVQ